MASGASPSFEQPASFAFDADSAAEIDRLVTK